MNIKRRLFCSLAVLAFIIMAADSFAGNSSKLYEGMGIVIPKVEKKAPKFELKNLEGETVRLSDFKGKAVLLNFWATWCEACKEEMPSMQRLYDRMRERGVEVIAVSIDRRNQDRVQDFVDEHRLTFPILLDQKQTVRREYFILGLPTSYLIGPDSKLRGYASGARAWDHPDLVKILDSLDNPS